MWDETGKLMLRRFRFSEFDFDLVHRVSIEHEAADPLSRLPTTGLNNITLCYATPCPL